MKRFFLVFVIAFSMRGILVGAAVPPAETGVFMLPINCSELMPDNAPFLNFLEAVGRGHVAQDKAFSLRIFKLIALRDRLRDSVDRSLEFNPVDQLLRKTLCFYREQKDPLRPIPYDDADFVKFLKSSLKELEMKVDQAIVQVQREEYQRKDYESRLLQNRAIIDGLKQQASRDASHSFDKLTQSAKKGARVQ